MDFSLAVYNIKASQVVGDGHRWFLYMMLITKLLMYGKAGSARFPRLGSQAVVGR